jgi:hypothetical protein
MEEKKLSNDIFNDVLWKNTYQISWCELCNSAVITCPHCKLSSCSGGGCDKCSDDFHEFNMGWTAVWEYLTHSEEIIYEKIFRLKHFILESLKLGDKKINFEKLISLGKLSSHDKILFSKDIEDEKKYKSIY